MGLQDGPDPAMIAMVDTRHCLGCKSLVEVPIEFHDGDHDLIAYYGGGSSTQITLKLCF